MGFLCGSAYHPRELPQNLSSEHLEEPTRGLHLEDITRLLAVLKQLLEEGNTVLVVEHHLDFIKCADWVINLGPGGGDSGGHIVPQDPPEEVANSPKSTHRTIF